MRVHIVDLAGGEAGTLQRRFHRAETAISIFGGRCDVIGVTRHAITLDLAIDGRTARARMLELFKNDNTRAFAHDKAVTARIPGARTFFRRIVIAGRQGPCGCEPGHANAADSGLGAAGNHDVGIIKGNHPCGIANGVRTGRTGRDNRVVRPPEAVFDRYVAGHEIDQRRRNKERGDPARTALVHQLVCLNDGFETADARSDHHAGAVLRFTVFRLPAAVLDSKLRGNNAELDETVLLALFARLDEGIHIEAARLVGTRHLPGNLACEVIDLKACDSSDTGLAGNDLGPVVIDADTKRRDHSKTGDNYATHVSLLIQKKLSKNTPAPDEGPPSRWVVGGR